jgi:hypothetical protein
MKSIRSFTLLNLAMGSLLAICLNSGMASAQTRQSGRFTLPNETHWGLATLPAGDYAFTVEGIGSEAKVHVYHVGDSVVSMRSQSYDTTTTPSHAIALTVVSTSAGYFVRDLSLPRIGQVFHFAAPKNGPGSDAGEGEIARISVTPADK